MAKTMVSARIPEKLNQGLEELAGLTRRSKGYLLTEALEAYVDEKVRLYRHIDEAVKQADEDGSYVSEKDMAAWLDSWGSPNELPPPRLRKRDEPDDD
ncbi:MAG: CopG family ribbon-helix-helix protein [Aestuariivirga sp.]